MKLTDKEIAKFNGVTDATLRNWKKPKQEGDVKFFPPYGKHNLYRGAKLATYLLKYEKEDNKENDVFDNQINNLELLRSNIQIIRDYIDMVINRDDLDDKIKSSLLKTSLDSAMISSNMIDDIDQIVSLTELTNK